MSGVACRKEMVHRRAWGRAKMRTAGGEVGNGATRVEIGVGNSKPSRSRLRTV